MAQVLCISPETHGASTVMATDTSSHGFVPRHFPIPLGCQELPEAWGSLSLLHGAPVGQHELQPKGSEEQLCP